MEICAGKEIKAGDRVILPVIRISTLRARQDRIVAVQITPLALLIVEPAGQYAVSFDGKPVTVEAILQMSASLREDLERVCV